MHGTEDEVVAPRNSAVLYRQMVSGGNSDVRDVHYVRGAGHNDLVEINPRAYTQLMREFIASLDGPIGSTIHAGEGDERHRSPVGLAGSFKAVRAAPVEATILDEEVLSQTPPQKGIDRAGWSWAATSSPLPEVPSAGR